MAEEKDKESEAEETYAVGIDLGTTYSCIAVWQDGKVTVNPNEHKQRTTPSVVAFTDTACLIGEAALQQSSANPLNTIFEAKRIIGRKLHDATVQEDMERYPFRVVASQQEDADSKPAFLVTYKGEEVLFHPEQISAFILAQLKRDAAHFLGAKVLNAVITVPAYFSDSQRQVCHVCGSCKKWSKFADWTN